MAAFPMSVWLAFMIIASWAESGGIGSFTSSVPSTVFIGKRFVYLADPFQVKLMMILIS